MLPGWVGRVGGLGTGPEGTHLVAGLDLVETLYAKVRRAGALGSLLAYHPLWERQAGRVPSWPPSLPGPLGAHHRAPTTQPDLGSSAHPWPQAPSALLRCPALSAHVGLLLPHFQEAPLALGLRPKCQTSLHSEAPMATGRRAEEQSRCLGGSGRSWPGCWRTGGCLAWGRRAHRAWGRPRTISPRERVVRIHPASLG